MPWTVQKKPDNVSKEEWDKRRDDRRRARLIAAGFDPDKKADIMIKMSNTTALVIMVIALLALVLYTWLLLRAG